MSGDVLVWLCQRPTDEGHEVYLEWPDGDRWLLRACRDYETADRVRGAMLAELDAWGWRSPTGGPLADPHTPLFVLATLWRAMCLEHFNGMWTCTNDVPDEPATEAPGDDAIHFSESDDEEDFWW